MEIPSREVNTATYSWNQHPPYPRNTNKPLLFYSIWLVSWNFKCFLQLNFFNPECFNFQKKAFDQETRTYSFLIPHLQKLRQQKKLKPLALPKCFYGSAEKELILMENLKVQKYEVALKKPERKFNKYYKYSWTFIFCYLQLSSSMCLIFFHLASPQNCTAMTS